MQARLFSKYFLLSILVLLTAYSIYLLRKFMLAIIFSCVFAYLFSGTYDWFRKKVKKDWLAAGLVILIISLAIIIPLLWLMFSFVTEAQAFISNIQVTSPEEASYFSFFIEEKLGITFHGSNMEDIISLLSSSVIPKLQEYLPTILTMFSNLGIQIFICAFLLFYLLIRKEKVVKTIIRYLPLTDAHSRLVLHEAGKTTKALVIGQGMIAILQGLAGAIGYLIFGIPGVFLWGFMMAIGSFIPFVGTALVWVPTGIILLLRGDLISGFGILIWGMLIVGNIDNLVRPKLVSMLGEIHPVVVLLGVFIGIAEFNILGIIIGPLLLQMLLLLYKLFKEEYIIE